MNRKDKYFAHQREMRGIKWKSRNPPLRQPSQSYVMQHRAWQGQSFYGDLQCPMFDFKLPVVVPSLNQGE